MGSKVDYSVQIDFDKVWSVRKSAQNSETWKYFHCIGGEGEGRGIDGTNLVLKPYLTQPPS